ncbi:phage integrase family protein, partial [Pseudomonas syringae pv. actinidiae str. M302091]
MKVVAVRRKELDLTESVLAHGPFRERFLAQPESIEPLVKVTGSALFADDERLLPLVSSYLNRHYRNTILADPTVLSYGRRISYLLTYLNAKPEYRTCDRDDALLSVGLGHLEAYLSKLDSDGLASTTVQSRDTTYNHLFSKHLCKPFGTTPPFRADNPYEHGPLRPGSADA